MEGLIPLLLELELELELLKLLLRRLLTAAAVVDLAPS
jgi:hypothetical protein